MRWLSLPILAFPGPIQSAVCTMITRSGVEVVQNSSFLSSVTKSEYSKAELTGLQDFGKEWAWSLKAPIDAVSAIFTRLTAGVQSVVNMRLWVIKCIV